MCIAPLNLKDRTVKCGQCKECLMSKAREWSIRLNQESKYSKSGYFLTITYDNNNVPLAVDKDTGEITGQTFNKKHVQDFLKRLRKAHSKYSNIPIRYYCTAEYGGRTGRAHYHMLIFNLCREVTSYIESTSKKAQHDHKLAQIWKMGHVSTGRIEGGSINYVTNYMLNKNKDVMPGQGKPFTLMSRGIGKQYVEKNEAWHNFHEIYKVNSPRPLEKRSNLPRYYMEKIFSEPVREMLNKEKEEEMQRITKLWQDEAEKNDPLDPLGWIKKTKEHNRSLKKRPDKAKRL